MASFAEALASHVDYSWEHSTADGIVAAAYFQEAAAWHRYDDLLNLDAAMSQASISDPKEINLDRCKEKRKISEYLNDGSSPPVHASKMKAATRLRSPPSFSYERVEAAEADIERPSTTMKLKRVSRTPERQTDVDLLEATHANRPCLASPPRQLAFEKH